MSYLGNEPPQIAGYSTQTKAAPVGSSITLNQEGTVNSILLFLDGVRQTPTTDYTVSGTTLTLTSTAPTTAVATILFLGDVADIGVPSDDTVNVGQLNTTSTGTTGQFLKKSGASAIDWATVDALPSQTSQSGKFLTTDGSAASWGTVASKDNLPTFYANMTGGNQTIGDNTATLVTLDNSIFDTASGMNVTASGTNPRSYTVQTGGAGKWCFIWSAWLQGSTGRTNKVSCALRKGGSDINNIIHQQTANDGFAQHSCMGVALADLIEGDYINLYATIDVNSGTPTIYTSGTWLQGFRLAE